MPEWVRVPLSEVVTPVQRVVEVRPGSAYRTIGVRWWGGGAYERQTIDGSQTAARTLSIVHENDLIINKIWVRHGSTAIAGPDVHGCAASNEFPTFEVNRDKVLPEWLHYLTQTKDFWARCDAFSQGTSGKNRIKPAQFLTIDIPLPPLPEQQRIVARVKGLLAKVEEAQRLRQETLTQLNDLVAAEERKIWSDDALTHAPSLEEVTEYLSRGRQSAQGESQHYLIKTQHVQMGQYVPTTARLSPDVASKVKPEAIVRTGDTLIACSAAGCLGRVAQYTDNSGKEASTDTHVAIARPRAGVVTSDYLYAYLRGAQGQHQLRSRERGDWQREKVGFRLTELNVADMRRIPIPVPSIAEQEEIVKTLLETSES